MHRRQITRDNERDHVLRRGRTRSRVAIAIVAALGLLAALPGSVRAQESDGDDPTPTTEPGRTQSEVNQPTGQVAYIAADGSVYAGIGEAKPAKVGENAEIGASGQGEVAVSPTADLIAYVRNDGALVTVPLQGGIPNVLATDVALGGVGEQPVISWEFTGNAIAYVAVGTEDQIADPGTQPRPRLEGSFLGPLPSGELGNTMKVVSTAGDQAAVIGDPSQRSMVGVNWSPTDPVILVDSVIPGSGDPYTVGVATGSSNELTPTVLSVDEPDFAPDGSFVVAVGPATGQSELVQVTLNDLEITTITVDDRVCNPAVSPDASRIVYGGGPNCERLMLISSQGGRAFDVTPLDTPDTAVFGDPANISWTADGRFITYPVCDRLVAGTTCSGQTVFLEPDTGRSLSGPEAVTVAPIRRPLVQDVWLDVQMRGPLEFSHSFVLSPDTKGALTDTEGGGILEGELSDGGTEVNIELANQSSEFLTGTIRVSDAESGIERRFMVLARASLLGVRILSISGVWFSTSEMPFASGKLDIAVRRR